MDEEEAIKVDPLTPEERRYLPTLRDLESLKQLEQFEEQIPLFGNEVGPTVEIEKRVTQIRVKEIVSGSIKKLKHYLQRR